MALVTTSTEITPSIIRSGPGDRSRRHTHGADYPTEVFRGLKVNELRAHGEIRNRRLILEAWNALNL